jgi:hypothetical protein
MINWYKGPDSLPVRFLKNLGIGLSQLGRAMLLGDPDETISGATGKASLQGKWWFKNVQEPFINALFWYDPDHCFKSIEADEGHNAVYTWYDRTSESEHLWVKISNARNKV